MILVRTEFQCQPGGVSAFVETFKAVADRMASQDIVKRSRIMTDLTGRFDTVVLESEIESMDAYFAMLKASFAAAGDDGPNLLAYQTGSRTFYTIEASYESGS